MIAEIITVADPLTAWLIAHFGLILGSVAQIGLYIVLTPIIVIATLVALGMTIWCLIKIMELIERILK